MQAVSSRENHQIHVIATEFWFLFSMAFAVLIAVESSKRARASEGGSRFHDVELEGQSASQPIDASLRKFQHLGNVTRDCLPNGTEVSQDALVRLCALIRMLRHVLVCAYCDYLS